MDEVIPLLKYDTRLDTKRIEDNTSYVLQDFVISKIIRYLNDDRYTLDSVKQSLIKFIDNYKGYIVSCIVEDDYGDRDGDTVRTITTVPIYREILHTNTQVANFMAYTRGNGNYELPKSTYPSAKIDPTYLNKYGIRFRDSVTNTEKKDVSKIEHLVLIKENPSIRTYVTRIFRCIIQDKLNDTDFMKDNESVSFNLIRLRNELIQYTDNKIPISMLKEYLVRIIHKEFSDDNIGIEEFLNMVFPEQETTT